MSLEVQRVLQNQVAKEKSWAEEEKRLQQYLAELTTKNNSLRTEVIKLTQHAIQREKILNKIKQTRDKREKDKARAGIGLVTAIGPTIKGSANRKG